MVVVNQCHGSQSENMMLVEKNIFKTPLVFRYKPWNVNLGWQGAQGVIGKQRLKNFTLQSFLSFKISSCQSLG